MCYLWAFTSFLRGEYGPLKEENCVLPTTMPDLLTNSPDAMFGELIKAPFKQEKKNVSQIVH